MEESTLLNIVSDGYVFIMFSSVNMLQRMPVGWCFKILFLLQNFQGCNFLQKQTYIFSANYPCLNSKFPVVIFLRIWPAT